MVLAQLVEFLEAALGPRQSGAYLGGAAARRTPTPSSLSPSAIIKALPLGRFHIEPPFVAKRLGLTPGQSGVAVAGSTHPVRSRVAGLERRWDLGCREHGDAYLCPLVIKPDGAGLCHDFSTSSDGTAKPNDLFRCLMSP